VAERITAPETVDFPPGEVMETMGKVVSGEMEGEEGEGEGEVVVTAGMGREQEAVLPPLEPRQDQRYWVVVTEEFAGVPVRQKFRVVEQTPETEAVLPGVSEAWPEGGTAKEQEAVLPPPEPRQDQR